MVARSTPLFASKEDENFREALKLYDQKQYKKALRLVESNLKKNSSHSESSALKGCINYHLGHKSDAESFILRALRKEPNNYLVDHLAGIYYRAVENYPESAKWMKAASDNGSPNKQILRDSAVLQTQVRDYKNLVDSRQMYLEYQPGYRANWTAVAVAHYLNKDYRAAESTLTKIEEIIKDHLTDADRYEQSECVLFKNDIIAESGDIAKALETLNKDEDEIKDKLAVLELRAKYLTLLGDNKQASLIYRELLKRNPDIVDYYYLLEKTLGTTNGSEDLRVRLYEKLAKFYPKSDPPQFLPLTFLAAESPHFEQKVKEYTLGQLKKGIPSAFINVKPLYKNKKKVQVIEKVVTEFLKNDVPKLIPTVEVWTKYFLAQHYLFLKNYEVAVDYIEAALKHSPTLVELYITKARILKHQGNVLEASNVMEEGRTLDLQDRFINSKSTKYLLRANKVNEAVDIISLFTKLDEDSVNGCKDLHLMQVTWFLVESAEAYTREYKKYEAQLSELLKSSTEEEEELKEAELMGEIELYKGLALKRLYAIVKIFDTFYNDQFDFHSYSVRRGTPRHYIAALKWEDAIRTTPIYTRALRDLFSIYIETYENHEVNSQLLVGNETKAKKSNKKNKKGKAQSLKKRADLISKVESEKNDADPLGAALLSEINNSPEESIDTLFELFKPLAGEGKDLILTWSALFKIYLIKRKYVLALQAIRNLNKILDPFNQKKPKVIGSMIYVLSDSAKKDSDANAAILKVVDKGLQAAFPEFGDLSREEFMKVYSHT
ncbi:uncharacterized protein PRCAT00006016001 [Priceomyces carsonii]|uniref:uncharacterized protein n=1 Tax=Priceomyces carsonii TaxID=28549 RepID=UPI002ED9B0AA|nr:unnamed protein product [Priceomyces carsonii]